MPFAEDLDVFLDTTGGFATACTMHGETINAIFEMAWVEIEIGDTPFSGRRPTLFGKETDFEGQKDSMITVDGNRYKIQDIQPDGTGMSLAILHKI